MWKFIRKAVVQTALSLSIILSAYLSGHAADIDDSTVFIEAFNAYQQKDYLLTLKKCDQLRHVFPDSPLRDVTLLLMARANLKSGENEEAAKSIALFTSEFPDSSLRASIEEELKLLASRQQKGEILSPDPTLQSAARTVRTDALARERAEEEIREMERAAKASAEQERLVRRKQEEELLEKVRLSEEKRARASIQAAVTLSDESLLIPVGGNGSLAFEIVNTGTTPEEYFLTLTAAKEYNARLFSSHNPDESVKRLQLAAGESFKGNIALTMPVNMVDGQRSAIKLAVVSAKFSDITFRKVAVVISSAPLIRSVAGFSSQKVTAGEKLRYKVTILNAGSLAAQDVTVRLMLPSQAIFQGAPETSFKIASDGSLLFRIDQLGSGNRAEINLDVKIHEDSRVGQELRGNIEIINNSLHRKDIFAARTAVIAQSRQQRRE